MKKVRWGVLGTAKIARTQMIPAILRSENAEIVGIASNSRRAKETAATFSIPNYFESYEELLHSKLIDAVYIPLPNHLHKKWTMEAAKHGKHVLCEKPASLSAEETVEMADICRKNHVKFMEALMYQFHPQHKRVQEIIRSGEIGEIKFMSASFSFHLDDKDQNIRMKKEMGGGSIYDVGSYCIHAIRNFLQSEPREVEAHAEIDHQTGVDTTAISYLKFENGLHATFNCSINMAFRQEYEIVGTKGRILVPRAFRPDTNGGKGLILVQTQNVDRKEKITADLYKLEIEHFSQAILDDFQPSYKAENAVNNMKIIDACYRSIKANQMIKVDQI